MDAKTIGILCFPLASLGAFIAIVVRWGIAAAVGFWFVVFVALVGWSLEEGRRARRDICGQIAQAGAKVIKMNYRYLHLGPYSLWNTSRTQHVYRVIVQEATGRERIVWARWGRRWFWNPVSLELRWQD